MGRTSDTKDKLIDSALELIGGRSYNTVGVQELCESAGVKKGSFYHFFPSKRDLTLEVLDEMWKQFKTQMLDPVAQSDLSAMDKFNALLTRAYEQHNSSKKCTGAMTGCCLGNLALELSTQDEVIRQKIEHIFKEWAKYFEGLVDEAISEGSLPEDTDPAATSKAMLAYIEGISLLGKTFNEPELIRRLGEGVLMLCIQKKDDRGNQEKTV